MKKLLNTLYVTTEGAALRKDGENLVVEMESMERAGCHFICWARWRCSAPFSSRHL